MLVNLLLLIAFLALAFAEKAGPALNWKGVAIDASGKYHVAAAAYNNDWDQGYPIYLSDDYGVNWRQSKSPAIDWVNVYSDSTGQFLLGYAAYNSFSSSSSPPLYISKDRGNTWETAAYFSAPFDIIGTNASLWTVSGTYSYTSDDVAKTWYMTGKIINGSGNYVKVTDIAVDSTDKHRYMTCDGGLCFSHNSGQTYTSNFSFPATAIEIDSTGQYVFVLNSKNLQYSTDYASTWTVLQDFTVSGSPAVTTNFLKITADHKYVYMLQKSSSSSTTTNLVRFTVSSKSSKTLFSTTNTVNDVAISATGNSIIVSTTANLFYTTNNSGTNWTTHTISV